jgi:solute carrier family 25 (mitochondrial phosphate transporter), member 23/24/25/41
MVLRGSKIKPDDSLEDAQLAIKRANKYLRQTRKELEKAKNVGIDTLKTIERKDSDGTSIVTKEELTEILGVLLDTIRKQEEEKRIAEIAVRNANENLRKTLLQLLCGGIAGATARSFVAPIDRVKILMQTQQLIVKDGKQRYNSVMQSLRYIVQNEGISKLWRGNGTNCIRVFPYAATQFVSYDKYKAMLLLEGGTMTIFRRLFAGALAGATATSLTHPLDVVRLRLSVQPELHGFKGAIRSVYMEQGMKTFFKGYSATLLSLAPFIAINFATFDQLKFVTYKTFPILEDNIGVTLGLGACAGLFAQSICFPLDTIRRRMQLPGQHYSSVLNAFKTVFQTEGMKGFYKGMAPNAIKVIPNNAIRFVVYDYLKTRYQLKSKRK